MPLIDENGVIDDPWVRVDGLDSAPTGAAVIVDVPTYASVANKSTNRQVGVDIGHSLDAGLSLIANRDRQPALISIDFSAMGDGRGFSIARTLRDAGYTGRLRAYGPLIADQFAFALSSGFNEIETTEAIAARQPKSHWLTAKNAFSARYQPNSQTNVLDQRQQRRDSMEVHAWAI